MPEEIILCGFNAKIAEILTENHQRATRLQQTIKVHQKQTQAGIKVLDCKKRSAQKISSLKDVKIPLTI